MSKINSIFFFFILSIPSLLYGQGSVEGKVFDTGDKEETGLPGASVIWAGTISGTSTNAAGYFKLRRSRVTDKLVISFIGYKNDTITVSKDDEYIKTSLHQNNELGEVLVFGRAPGAHINKTNPVLTVNITGTELRKAACCNLSESFETSASIDVNYTDAATGAKQIQLLGLAGNYTQILSENIPSMYGLASAYGLNYIPGPWMESIQVSKGTSSVRNGYESIAGQINVEYKKPATSEKVYVNGFMNDAGKQELNANASVVLDDKLSTMILAHAENQSGMSDHNKDGFRDEPDVKQYHFINRWDYLTKNGDIRVGVNYLEEERIGGQLSYKSNNNDTWNDGFGINILTKRLEAFTKAGRLFTKSKSMSVGWIQNYSYHSQDSYFGLKNYTGTQNSYYTNLLYQWTPLLSRHTLDAGISYKYDLYDEHLDSSPLGKKESVPGAFVQYTYADTSKVTLVAGMRVDNHNLYGTLLTPRVHLRYELFHGIILRASLGKGYRSANVLAENSFLLASSRNMFIASDLRIEEAWNSGVSLAGHIDLHGKEIKLSGEFFHTGFVNQIITDLDADVNEVSFYNLNGRSFSNVLQFEASFQPVEGFDLLAAWRFNDVMMTIDDVLSTKPLASRYKGVLTASWLTHLRKWQYDYTIQLNGPGRIPSTFDNPEEFRLPDSFNAFTVMNAQVTRNFKKFHIYAGVENLLNFTQHMAIIDANDPFGEYFDSSLIWGPVHGRKIYAGFRFFINRDLE
ncbi:MAG TPA: TonB-dependent receptor [Bacteroidales bacterium]|nr:TonB-dependent receptor [Bacteroidales bacterium]